MPASFAIKRLLQCVLAAGLVSSVLVMTSSTFASSMVRGAPERGASTSPAKPSFEKRVRHLPVLEGEKPIDIISIGDLVKSIIGDQKFMIDQLEHYIHG